MQGPDKACSVLSRQMTLALRHGGWGSACSHTNSRTLRSWPALAKQIATLRGAPLHVALCKGRQ